MQPCKVCGVPLSATFDSLWYISIFPRTPQISSVVFNLLNLVFVLCTWRSYNFTTLFHFLSQNDKFFLLIYVLLVSSSASLALGLALSQFWLEVWQNPLWVKLLFYTLNVHKISCLYFTEQAIWESRDIVLNFSHTNWTSFIKRSFTSESFRLCERLFMY